MKKNLFYLFLSMAIAVVSLTSCEKDENLLPEKPKVEGGEQQDQRDVTAFDALEWLQGSLVVVGTDGEVLRRVYGKPLDESQPTVISVPVADYEAAKELFLSWVAPDKQATEVEGGYDYNLTDDKGNAQGSVSFRAVTDEAGVMARMTVAEGTALKQISEVEFLEASLWPENDDIEKFEAGKIYTLATTVLEWSFDQYNNDYYGFPETQEKPFYCVQGNTNGKEAILVWLCPDDNLEESHPTPSGYIHRELYHHLPTVSEAEKVLDFFNANYDAWQKMLKEMDAKGYQWSPASGYETTGNSEFILNSYDEEENEIKFLDLDGEEGDIDEAWGRSYLKYRYMQIRIFPPIVE